MLSRLLRIGCAAALAGTCCVPLFASPVTVSAASQTVTLTSAQTLALFGNSIEISYSTPGEGGNISYSSGVAVYNNSAPYGGDNSHIYSSEGQSFIGREFLLYRFSAPDLTIRPSSISVNIKTAVDISSVDYIDTAIAPWVDSGDFDVSAVLYGSREGYWHCSDGDHFALHQDQIGQPGYNLYGYLPYASWVMIPFSVCSFPSSSFSFGWWSTNLIDQNGDGNYYFAIFCPILSENWVYSGDSGAGEGGSSDSSGSSGDDTVTDLSPVVSRLDQILAKLDQLIAASDSGSSDSSENAADSQQQAENAQKQESQYNDASRFQAEVNEVADLQDVSMPDLENHFDSLPDDFSAFWYVGQGDGRIATIYTTMAILGLGVAALAYVIFGKNF